MRLWHRGISNKERNELEAQAWARFKRHVDFENVANTMRELRDEIDALSECLWEAWPVLPEPVKARAAELIGAPAEQVITPIGITMTGKFVDMEAS